LIEAAGLGDEVEIQVRDQAIVITSRTAPRSGWADAARRMRAQSDDRLLDEPTRTRFDAE